MRLLPEGSVLQEVSRLCPATVITMRDTARLRGGIIARVGHSDHRGDIRKGLFLRFNGQKYDASTRDKMLALSIVRRLSVTKCPDTIFSYLPVSKILLAGACL